ncbi:MAG TPA: hypothetical protein PLQ35_09355 [bacterium]|nr:hypothetical protein [bacterium]HQL62488.1 hypothetical protein [bacterium]
MNSDNALSGQVVEIHLLSGKRFLGKVLGQDRDGVVMCCIPLRALETMPPSGDVRRELQEMKQTLFIPWIGVEYVDIGGHPIGFNDLYAGWFGGGDVGDFFETNSPGNGWKSP